MAVAPMHMHWPRRRDISPEWVRAVAAVAAAAAGAGGAVAKVNVQTFLTDPTRGIAAATVITSTVALSAGCWLVALPSGATWNPKGGVLRAFSGRSCGRRDHRLRSTPLIRATPRHAAPRPNFPARSQFTEEVAKAR